MCEFLVYYTLGYVSKHYIDRPEELRNIVIQVAINTRELVQIFKDNFKIEIK